MCHTRFDPGVMRPFDDEEPGGDYDDMLMEFGRYQSEAAKSLTRSFQDEEIEDE